MIGTRPLTPNSAGITGPMNINAVIAHLVEMTPPQRKQFAQMHMDDPMMLSAAKYVDTQIAKQAQSLAAQATGAAPPPVNQQVVAQMSPQPPVRQTAPQPQAAPQDESQPMPEDTGIAQLPAQNMPGQYAAGGIVAFAKGGVSDALAVIDQNMPDPRVSLEGFNRFNGSMTDYLNARQKAISAVKSNFEQPNPEVLKAYESVYGRRPAGAAPEAPAKPAAIAPAVVPVVPRVEKAPSAPPEKVEAAPKEKKGIEQLRADKISTSNIPAVAPTVQASSAPAASGLDYNAAFSSALKAEGNPRDNLPPEINEIADLTKAQGEKEAAAAEKRGAGLKALVDARNERLAGREARVAQEENMNPFMSLLTAGLSTMQSKGKGLAGIAEGSQAGVAQYMAEAKYTTAQRQKLEDARDALEDLKFNQENMTEKERLAAQNTIAQGAITAKKATVEHIAHKEDINLKTAGHKFDAMVQRDIETQREGSAERLEGQRQQFQLGLNAQQQAHQERLAIAQMNNALKAAGISASAPLATKLEFLKKIGAAPEDSALYKGYMLTEQADKEPRMYAEYQKLATDDMKGPAFVQRFPTFEAFKAGMSSTGGGGTINKAGWGQAVKN